MKKTKGKNGGTLLSMEKGETLNPKGRPVNSITEYIKAGLKADREIIIEGIDVETGQVRKFRVKNPTAEVIGGQILRQAAKGMAKQQEMVLDRTEGKVLQKLEQRVSFPPILEDFRKSENDRDNESSPENPPAKVQD